MYGNSNTETPRNRGVTLLRIHTRCAQNTTSSVPRRKLTVLPMILLLGLLYSPFLPLGRPNPNPNPNRWSTHRIAAAGETNQSVHHHGRGAVCGGGISICDTAVPASGTACDLGSLSWVLQEDEHTKAKELRRISFRTVYNLPLLLAL